MTIISLIVTLLLFLMCALIVIGGRALQNNVPSSGQQEIDWNWQHGYHLLAVRQTLGYFSYQSEGRIRAFFARPFYDKMNRLRAEGDLEGALLACSQFEKIVDHYGGIGAHFYECIRLQEELEN
jgi:hypothetical protein